MSLSKADVEKVSLLARLKLTDDELATMTRQLDQVIQYVQQFGELDTSDVQPMAHAADLTNVFADDVLRASLSREAALANAPKRDDACYLVPPVLGD